jgi:hypothetical protein
MSAMRSFPFGKEPAAVLTQATTPLPMLPPNPQATAPLVNFMPPADALPFDEPPAAPMLLTAPILPLVPPLPPRTPARSRASFRTAAALVLLVLDVVVLVYLAATWGR